MRFMYFLCYEGKETSSVRRSSSEGGAIIDEFGLANNLQFLEAAAYRLPLFLRRVLDPAS